MAGRKPTAIEGRFAERCNPVASGCVEWTGGTVTGYGYFHVGPGNRMMLAHRWLYEFVHGVTLASNIDVCHSCDNPLCVNIDHLFAGTRLENMQDAVRKGRTSHVARTRGESHPMAMLCEKDIRDIRSRHDAGEAKRALATEFKVSFQSISRIVRHISWKHIS